jgi:hypothetical protein
MSKMPNSIIINKIWPKKMTFTYNQLCNRQNGFIFSSKPYLHKQQGSINKFSKYTIFLIS